MPLPDPKPDTRTGLVPMIMRLSAREILLAVNNQLINEGKPCLPPKVTISVSIPGGGDYSNMDLELDESITLDLRYAR